MAGWNFGHLIPSSWQTAHRALHGHPSTSPDTQGLGNKALVKNARFAPMAAVIPSACQRHNHHMPPCSQLLSRAQRGQAAPRPLSAQSHAWLPSPARHTITSSTASNANPPPSLARLRMPSSLCTRGRQPGLFQRRTRGLGTLILNHPLPGSSKSTWWCAWLLAGRTANRNQQVAAGQSLAATHGDGHLPAGQLCRPGAR